MLMIYKLGNFKNGKAVETESKSAMHTYLSMGYTLITVAWVSTKDYLTWKAKQNG